jgi:hypothetical protein
VRRAGPWLHTAAVRRLRSSCLKSSPRSPRPAINLFLYHGALAPHARWRPQVVRYARPAPAPPPHEVDARPRDASAPGPWPWAALMRRVFHLDVLACTRCGGRLQAIATIQDPAAVQAIVAHLARDQTPQSLTLAAAAPAPYRTPRLTARDREPAAVQDHSGATRRSRCPPRLRPPGRSRLAAGGQGEAGPGPTPGAPAEVAFIVPMRSGYRCRWSRCSGSASQGAAGVIAASSRRPSGRRPRAAGSRRP